MFRLALPCYLSLFLLMQLFGCTADPIIRTLDEVDFENLQGHWVNYHVYEMGHIFTDVDLNLALKAARAGLLYADFDVVDSDKRQYRVSGNRDATAREVFSNPVGVSVYLREAETHVIAKVIYNRHVTQIAGNWEASPVTDIVKNDISEIFRGMRRFIDEEQVRHRQEAP